MNLELHHFPLSTATQKVRLCQHHKGLTFAAEHVVDLVQLQQLAPAYLAINPRGQVPALVVDGRTLGESSIINEFLEESFPDRPLLPRDPLLRAEIRMWTKYVDADPTVQIASPTYAAWVAPALAGHPDRDGLLALVSRAPEPIIRARWQRTVRAEISAEELAAAWQSITDMLARMNDRLAAGPWLFGADYSLADVEATPIVVRVTHLGRTDLLTPHPRVTAWFERVQALPNFTPTYAFLQG